MPNEDGPRNVDVRGYRRLVRVRSVAERIWPVLMNTPSNPPAIRINSSQLPLIAPNTAAIPIAPMA